jgi:hypothetical protein
MSAWSVVMPVLLASAPAPADAATTMEATPTAATPTAATPTAAAPDAATTTARLALGVEASLAAWRAPLARALLEAGFVVAGPFDSAASHRVTVEAAEGGVVVVVRGATTKLGVVPPGPAALVELEVAQRVAALVLATAPTAGLAPADDVTVALQVDGDDVEAREALTDLAVVALLDGGVALSPGGGARALCVVVGAAHVDVGVAATAGASCGDVQRTAREAFRPAALVERLRPAPPAPVTTATTPTPPPMTTPTTPTPLPALAAATSPWTLGVAGGVLMREAGVDPLLWSSVAHRVAQPGPVDVDVVAVVAGSGSVADLVVVEPVLAVGVATSLALPAGVRLGAGLLGGAQLHGYRFERDVGVAGDGLVMLPLTVTVPLSDTLGLQLGASGGASTRARSHTIDGVEAWRRGNLFLSIFGGLSFSLPTAGVRSAGPDENANALARGAG